MKSLAADGGSFDRQAAAAQRLVREREQRDARGIAAQGAGTETDGVEAVGAQQLQFESVPASLGTDGQQEPLPLLARNDAGDRFSGRGVGNQAQGGTGEGVEVVLDQDAELPVYGDDRQLRVARLLQSFEQQRPVAGGLQQVGVEVVPLDPRGVGQDDAANAQRGELRPETPKDLRTGDGQQQVDSGANRGGAEGALERDAATLGRQDAARAAAAIHDADAKGLLGHDAKHGQQVTGAGVVESRPPVGVQFVGLEQQQVHSEMSRIAAALAAPPVYAAEALHDSGTRARDDEAGGLHPVLLTRLFLLLAAAVVLIVLAARGSWLLVPVALLPLAALAWLAAHYAGSRSASWVVLGLSVLVAGPAVLALLASLT